MPKPDDVSSYDIEQWEQIRLDNTADEDISSAAAAILPNYTPPDIKEMFYASQWLRRKLENIGTTDEAVVDALQSDGQRQFFGPIRKMDPWEISQESFDLFQESKLPSPGDELSKQLSEEYMPSFLGLKAMPPEPGQIIEQCYKLNSAIENKNGKLSLEVPMMVHVAKDCGVVVSALSFVGPEAAKLSYMAARKAIEDGARELCFVMDRYLLQGQGTTLQDGFTVNYWNGDYWQFGIVEYDEQGVKPIAWDNEFWIDVCSNETAAIFGPVRVTRSRKAPVKQQTPTHQQFRNVENLLREDPDDLLRVAEYLQGENFSPNEVARLITLACVKLGINP